jgi:hypothetical protein
MNYDPGQEVLRAPIWRIGPTGVVQDQFIFNDVELTIDL